MTSENAYILYPCPVSKGYGIPEKQAWQLLTVYFIYRFVLASSFGIFFHWRFGPSLLGSIDSKLFGLTAIVYFIVTAILGFCVFLRKPGYSFLAQVFIFTDIVFLTLLMHASGGISSGLGMLIAVAIAAGGLLIGGRCALVFAAIASLAILAAEVYAAQNQLYRQSYYTYAGMLGAAYFAIALLSLVMARRSEQMMKLTDQQQQTIVQLEELNRYVIQHMQSGIIITGQDQTVLMANQSALRLTHLTNTPTLLDGFSGNLATSFMEWQNKPEKNQFMLEFAGEAEIQCRIIRLPMQPNDFCMLILEDGALYNQRVQQSKLASLGRLTASIAHEIRNPLGAISHAGQLLSENPQIDAQDRRLIEIIKTNSGRVNHIIEDILNLSRRTESTRQSINLNHWLVDYLDNFYLEKSVATGVFRLFQEDNVLRAVIDSGHLKQIMDNLCQNALRYGRPDLGEIRIKLLGTANGPCIEVSDNGSGISPEHQKQLFEPFFTTSASGTGLGLYICRELAELNQAKLSYILSDEKRSCFRLILHDADLNTIEL